MSKHHAQIKNDPRWKAAKQECHDRDGWACVVCGETEGIQADHILRLSEYPDLAFDVDNLQTLCEYHHQEKERTNDTKVIRNTWINPAYPELNECIPIL